MAVNLIKWGLDWQTGQFRDHASEDAIYRRGTQEIPVRAMPGKKLLRLADEFGNVRLEWTDMDVFIPTVQIDFGAGPTAPLRGDELDLFLPYDVQTFEAFPYDASEGPFRMSDPVGQTYVRIHMKRTKVQPEY